jgi:glycine/D-amino acid oxidase-like deaminating enzyme
LHANLTDDSQLHVQAFLFARRFYQYYQQLPLDFAQDWCGVLHLATNGQLQQRQQKLLQNGFWPAELVHAADAITATELAGVKLEHSGIYFPLAGWLNPQQFCRQALDYLRQQAQSIDPHRATPSASLPPAQHWREGEHTTHFTVLDAEGNAVAATLSLNSMFGAAFTVAGTGILLNNEMDDFAIDVAGSNAYGLHGTPANALKGGKRPVSSMAPSFVESEEDFVTFGTPGGSQIPSMPHSASTGVLPQRT